MTAEKLLRRAACAAQRADMSVLVAMRTRGHHRAVERAVALYSRAGEHSLLWLTAAAVGVTAHRGRRGIYLSCGRTVVAGEVLNATAKALVGRRRPSIGHLPPLTAARSQLSHPSAHATTSFAAAAVLSRALPPVIPYSLAAGMALSRPYLGVHYPSDVVVGCAFGLALARMIG